MIIECLLISAIITYIWDYVRFPQSAANQLISWLSKGKITQIELKKPFGCSLCMTTWVTLIYLLIAYTGESILCMFILSLTAGWCTRYILLLFSWIDIVISKIFSLIEKPFTIK